MLRYFETFLLKLGTIPDDKTKFYVHWVRRFLKSCNFQLENINTGRVSQYLDSLEGDEKVADWQVKQAADAVTLYVEQYLKKPLQQIPSFVPRAKRKMNLPTGLSRDEVKKLLSFLNGQYLLMAQLMYGCGLRLMECLHLRIKDVDFENDLLIICSVAHSSRCHSACGKRSGDEGGVIKNGKLSHIASQLCNPSS